MSMGERMTEDHLVRGQAFRFFDLPASGRPDPNTTRKNRSTQTGRPSTVLFDIDPILYDPTRARPDP